MLIQMAMGLASCVIAFGCAVMWPFFEPEITEPLYAEIDRLGKEHQLHLEILEEQGREDCQLNRVWQDASDRYSQAKIRSVYKDNRYSHVVPLLRRHIRDLTELNDAERARVDMTNLTLLQRLRPLLYSPPAPAPTRLDTLASFCLCVPSISLNFVAPRARMPVVAVASAVNFPLVLHAMGRQDMRRLVGEEGYLCKEITARTKWILEKEPDNPVVATLPSRLGDIRKARLEADRRNSGWLSLLPSRYRGPHVKAYAKLCADLSDLLVELGKEDSAAWDRKVGKQAPAEEEGPAVPVSPS